MCTSKTRFYFSMLFSVRITVELAMRYLSICFSGYYLNIRIIRDKWSK